MLFSRVRLFSEIQLAVRLYSKISDLRSWRTGDGLECYAVLGTPLACSVEALIPTLTNKTDPSSIEDLGVVYRVLLYSILNLVRQNIVVSKFGVVQHQNLSVTFRHCFREAHTIMKLQLVPGGTSP